MITSTNSSKITIFVLLGIIGVLIIVLLYPSIKGILCKTTDEAKKIIEKPPIEIQENTSVERVVERVLPNREFKGEFATTGRGQDAKWGVAQLLNFQYTVSVIAESKILNKASTESGYIVIEEVRTFKNVSDSLVASDVDFVLCLDTIPVSTISKAVDLIAGVYSELTGDVATGCTIITGKDWITQKLQTYDGVSLRQLWGLTGLSVPGSVEASLNKLANAKIRKAIGVMREISGKSYKLKWYQAQSGEPMYLTYSYEDGSEVTNEEELMVLRRVNTFIDYYLVPDEQCQPGDTWRVSAENLQEVFDPYVDGKYVGAIGIIRKEDRGEDWYLELTPSEIRVQSENNETTGELSITKGYAQLEPKDITLKDLFAEGTANIRKVSRHHLLFTAHIDGVCQFQGRLVSRELPQVNPSSEDTSESEVTDEVQ